jgi:uncharacterized protein (DUF1697 family)
MPQYIAFLRGINVGGHRVKMDRLRELFTELGLQDVSTFIASGNVVFSTDSGYADGLGMMIEGHLARSLGYEVATFLRSPAELAAIAAFRLPGVDKHTSSDSSHYVILLDTTVADPLRAGLTQLSSDTDRFHFAEREIHWLVRGKLSESPLFGPGIDRATRGVRMTMRNINTLRRIAAKVGPGAPGPSPQG